MLAAIIGGGGQVFLARGDRQDAAGNAGIFQTVGGVILLLVIVPAGGVCLGVIGPDGGIRQAVGREVIFPDEIISCRCADGTR